MVCCARCRSLHVADLSTLSHSISLLFVCNVVDLSTLSHSISLLFGRNVARSPVVAEIWSNFGFCGVVFESLVVDAVVFLGFVVNLWVSVSHQFWVLWMLLFSGFVNLCGSPLVFLHLLVFFFFLLVVVARMDMSLLS